MVHSAPFRRKLVSGHYQFGVFYILESKRLIVHAIIDLRKDPEQILKRLGS